ncbi:MAG: 50S ribosomal protein L23, partial [Clostridia bacterium]|nr:50S ribosomal protein L23 [Clostridia bacterium]
MKTPYDIIKKPVLSEQSYDNIIDKKYTFLVDVNATKPEIKDAIEKIFGVSVARVNTARTIGKMKR